MNILTKYLIKKYLIYFFIILLSLEIFFIGIDFLQNVKKLPDSANLQLLYIFYNGFFTFTITLPLSLVFAWIVTLTLLIKNNELVSFYSLGISKKAILTPIVLLSLLFTLILISLQATPMAYSYEEKKKILDNRYFVSEQSNIFLKYNEYFVYFKKLYPLEKKAEGVRIFKTKNNDIVETVIGEKAYYQNNKWYVVNTKITKKPSKIDWSDSKLDISYEKFLYTLEDFEPKIINNVYKAKVQFSIIDAIYTILLLDDQGLNTNKIKAILYSLLFMPLFVIPLIVLVYLFTNESSRFFNTATFVTISVFGTLLVWGALFLLQKLAFGDVLVAELAILLPLCILFVVTYYIYNAKVE
ncbi:MAG: LptF/LptG family permease [Campylobacterota bacterium]|nr:LptF/LptG family permease [Campylobacterota bacterium]